MSLRIWLSALVLALVTLVGVPAQAAEVPVTTSLSGDNYAVTFGGDDADLSFTVSANAVTALTTGAGWISPFGEHASFGFIAGSRLATPFGQVAYIDHASGFRVKSTEILFNDPFSCTNEILAVGDSNLGPVPVPVHFTVTVADGGEPGAGNDFFMITVLELGYSRSGVLEGGDIQVHDPTCP
jgi:hypothetical protein